MEALESPAAVVPLIIEPSIADNEDSSPIEPEDSEMPALKTISSDASMTDETEAARLEDDTIMEHAGSADDPETVEFARGEPDELMVEDDGNTRDTCPMLEFDGNLEEEAEDKGDQLKAADDTDMKEGDNSPSTDGDNSQSIPGTTSEVVENLTTGNLPKTFPNCFICGFDRETVFMKEKKALSGMYKGKVIFRNRCVRKACIRYFGPSYMWDRKLQEYVKISEESGACIRPFINGPREEKFPDIEYERAGPSGVRPPPSDFTAAMRLAKTAKHADSASPSGSGSPAPADRPKRTSAASAARIANAAAARAASAAAAARKQRKGYQWVVEEVEVDAPPKPNPVVELARMYAAQHEAEMAAEKAKVVKRTCSSQTGDEEHLVQIVVEELRKKADFKGLKTDDEVPLSGAITNRLFLAQKTIKKQMKEMADLRRERDAMFETLRKFSEAVVDIRNESVSDMQRLKEDVSVANKELKNFGVEMQNEANKDIRDLKKLKEQIAKRLEDTENLCKRTEKAFENSKLEKKEVELLADAYHRRMVELEKKITIARLEADDAMAKLNDKIYLTNNAKCTHCQVNERIKDMLTEQITEKTLSATNLGKERTNLARKLENSERIAKIVSKENERLKFEIRAWETNCHRMKSEMQAMKGNHPGGLVLLPPSSSTSMGEAAFTPQSCSKEGDGVTPERLLESSGQEAEGDQSMGEGGGGGGDQLLAAISQSTTPEEGEYKSPSPPSLTKLPPPPVPPAPSELTDATPGDPAFSAWIPKEQKKQEIPREMLEAMRKVEESLEKGPIVRKKEEKGGGGGGEKKEKGGGKRGGGGMPAMMGNGEKKMKMGDEHRRRKNDVAPPPRPIPSLVKSPLLPGVMHKMAEKEKRREMEEKKREETVPFSSSHEPAFPAGAVSKKNSVKVPYNGPSTLSSSSSSSSSGPSSSRQSVHTEKKPLSFLPVAGSTAPVPPREPSRAVPVDAILREAERLRDIEREREMRRERERREREALMRPDPYYDRQPPPRVPAIIPARFDFNDDELPWNQGRPAAPNYQQPTRPRTPTQDWYYDQPPAHLERRPEPRQAPSRYYDEMYDPNVRRDQYGRIEPDFGAPQMRPPLVHGGPVPLGPPRPLLGHPADQQWRREWHEPNWSEDAQPPRRNYWE